MIFFADHQQFIILLWIALVFVMIFKGRIIIVYRLACLISVACAVGHIALISLGVFGAGFSPGIVFPGYDAFIDPFILFFVGVPVVTMYVFVAHIAGVIRSRKIQLLEGAYVAASIYLLWIVWFIYVDAISSV